RHSRETFPLFCPLPLTRKLVLDRSGQPPIQSARRPRPRRAIHCSTPSSSFPHRWTCTARFQQSQSMLHFALPMARRVPPTEPRRAPADSQDPLLILPRLCFRLYIGPSPNSPRHWLSEKRLAPRSVHRGGPAPQRTRAPRLSDPQLPLLSAALPPI